MAAESNSTVSSKDIQNDALSLLAVHYVADGNPIKRKDIETMIRDVTSLKVIWTKWSHCNWQKLLHNQVGAIVMWQLFHNHRNQYDEFFGNDAIEGTV